MRAYVAGGRVGSALSAYAKARQRLAEDLGADPSPETDALHGAILRGEVAVANPVLPSAIPRLVGRSSEMDRLDVLAAHARTGSFEFVVVEGEAGIGKTSLLQAWSARRAAIGEVVLVATFGSLDRALPLDGLLAAIGAYLRAAGPERTAEGLGADAELVAPMLGLAEEAGMPPALADGVVGPFTLFAAVLRVLQRAGAICAARPGARRRTPGRAGAGGVAGVRAAPRPRDGRRGRSAVRRGHAAAAG